MVFFGLGLAFGFAGDKSGNGKIEAHEVGSLKMGQWDMGIGVDMGFGWMGVCWCVGNGLRRERWDRKRVACRKVGCTPTAAQVRWRSVLESPEMRERSGVMVNGNGAVRNGGWIWPWTGRGVEGVVTGDG